MVVLQQMSDHFLMIRVALVAQFTAQPLRLRQMAKFVGAQRFNGVRGHNLQDERGDKYKIE